MPFQIIRNDITKVKADAIVNTANPEPVFSDGTDGALYRAAGEEKLPAERKKIGRIPVGGAALTPAFGLDAEYIIHTVGPVWQGGGHGEADAVRRCYRNSLRLAQEHGCESIAFPLISTGIYGFPKEEALQIALAEISDFLMREDMLVWLVVFDSESFGLSEKLFAEIDSYIDEYYVADRTAEEYGAVCAGAPADSFDEGSKGSRRKRSNAFQNLRRQAEDSLESQREETDSLKFPMPPSGQQRGAGGKGWPVPSARQGKKEPKPPAAQYAAAAGTARISVEEHSQIKPPGLFQKKKRSEAQERSLEDVVAQLGETFQQRLFRLIDERSLTDVEVYKKANLDRKLFSKIRCNADYRPKKITAVALAVALELSLDETKDLLSRAEMALSPSSKFDLIITYFIEREVYDVYTINVALFQHGQPLLGA